MKITLADQTKGINGSYTWEDEHGVGTMTNIKAEKNKLITQEMQFAEYPKSDVLWDFKPNEDGSTDVTWSISGKKLPFGFKAFAAFSGRMEKQIGPHYERSLEKLDSIVNVDMKKYSITVNGISQHSGGYYLYNTTSCKIDQLASKMEDMLPKVMSYAKKNNIVIAGVPYVNYHKWDIENNAVMFSCCIPTTEKINSTKSDILTGQLLPFKALKTTLKGDYINLKQTWDTALKHIENNNLEQIEAGTALETYLTAPMNTPNPANSITEIYIAIK